MDTLLQESWFIWGLVLTLVFPVTILTVNEIRLKVRPRSIELSKIIQEIRNLILPMLALRLLLVQVLGLASERLDVRLVDTLFWVSLLHVALSFVNFALFTGAKPGSWQMGVPKILSDMIRVVLILIGLTVVLSVVWQADLGGLITALGVSSIVLGLALQDALGNLFSGVALLFERPFQVGDWLQMGDTVGQVAEVNWRSVHLITREQELLIVPSSILAREVIRNYRRPKRLHIEPISLGFSYDDPPNKVKRVLREAALETTGVLSTPEPVIQTVSYDDSSIGYRARLYLPNYDNVPQVRDEYMTRIWYAARRNQISIPFPIRTLYHQPTPRHRPDEVLNNLVNYLRSLPSLTVVESDDLSELAQSAVLKHFGMGETVIHQQATHISPYFILAGQATVSTRTKQGTDRVVTYLGRGDFFGADALLTTQYSSASVVAQDDLEVISLSTEVFQRVLERNARLAKEIGAVVSLRKQAIQEAYSNSANGASAI
ncbi:MAG: mechanosensitive ion channel family protein [Cyanobacteria bacterium J06554_6]